MPQLISPGVSVTVTDESFFVPASAPTVPLFFVGTRANKVQPNGVSVAMGTTEHGTVRTVTSLAQSVALYGVPHFRVDQYGNQLHGDARNEYGIFALNQFLEVGNRAYVVRANIDLRDEDVVTLVPSIPVYSGTGDGTISTNLAVDQAAASAETWTITAESASLFRVVGSVSGEQGYAILGTMYDNGMIRFLISAGTVPFQVGDEFAIAVSLNATTPTLTGAGNGSLATLYVDPTSPAQTWTIHASTAATWTVTGSISGPQINASSGVPYSNGLISFTIVGGTNNFAAGDEFIFDTSFSATSQTFIGLGNGSLSAFVADQNAGLAEVWEVTALDSVNFSVTGSVTGVSTPAVTGVPYDNGMISFTIVDGTIAFVAGDSFQITVSENVVSNPLGANDAAKRVAVATALQAAINSNTDVRSEYFEYNLILCPGYHEAVDELLALSTAVKDEAFVVADTPMFKSPETTATWSMTSERFFHTNVSYYYPAGLASNLDGSNVVCAASGVALKTIAYSDSVGEVWFAPAGMRRGVVTGVSKVGYLTGTPGTPTTFVESNLNQGQRDVLYEYGKNVNPLVFFPGRGLIVWGQKTSAPAASALDRVNVVRMMMKIKRDLRKASYPYIFEPNDQRTRDALKSMVDSYLGDIVTRRGLYDFASVCDDSNNTPDRIDRNELWIDIATKPTKAAEFIYVPIRVVSTGAKI
jgi:hypothetical protein